MAEIEVKGIREVSLAFRKIDKDLPKQLQVEFLRVAGRVAHGVQAKVPVVTGKARSSVRPRARQKGASIAVGGTAAPYFPWLDFGGTTGKGHKPGVSWSGSVKREMPVGGRYVYPAIDENRDEIMKAAENAPVNVARLNGFEVR